uniref:hypothetical protein n=1 Tax=Ningiella ruwaisensis TaxID=2364274 RepID=UPI00109EF2A2|nr:hypothetical protein [Ningiella ruwaisensis]
MTKRYVNRFCEISHLSEAEQVSLLEKARVEAFVKMKLSGRSAIYMFGSLLACSGIGLVGGTLLFGYESIYFFIILAISIFANNYINARLQGTLIRRGLTNILSKPHA